MFRAHIVVVESVGLLTGEGENLLGARGEIVHGVYFSSGGSEVQFTHGGLGDAFEFFAEEISAEGVALLGSEFFLGSLLEVSGLGRNEKSIELGLEIGGEQSEICR
jgi:hypothetical protein